MRKLVVSEWMTLDGVFDADTMDTWWLPYESVERQEDIQEGIEACDAMLYGRTTYEMLAPIGLLRPLMNMDRPPS
jgi:hypothetical protein